MQPILETSVFVKVNYGRKAIEMCDKEFKKQKLKKKKKNLCYLNIRLRKEMFIHLLTYLIKKIMGTQYET